MSDDVPRLAALTLDQLDEMLCAFDTLKRAGDIAAELCFKPLFCVLPGSNVSMHLDWSMPPSGAPSGAETLHIELVIPDPTPAAADPVAEAEKAPAEGASGGGQEASDPAAAHQPEPTPEPEQSAPVAEAEGAGDGGEGVAAPAPAVAPEDPEKLGGDRGGLQRLSPAEHDPVQAADTEADIAAPSAAEAAPAVKVSTPPSPPPGSASALAAMTVWTDAEDARLIQITVGAMIMGAPKAAAIRAAAEELGRPFSGAQSRLYSRLKTTFEAALREAEASKNHAADPIPEPAAPFSPAAGASDGGVASPAAPVAPSEDPGEPAPIAATKAPLSPIEAHLFALPAKGGWTMARDFNLLSLSELGWKPGEIAEDMGIDARQVQDRWDRLSGLDPETKLRRWTRAELIAALKGWVGKGGK